MIPKSVGPSPAPQVPKEWPTHPYTKKTAAISFVALLIFSLAFPYVSLPIFIGTVVTLAATGTVAATIDTIDAIAHGRFWRKDKLQEAIDSRYGTLLATVDTKTLMKDELEKAFVSLRVATLGPNQLWQTVCTDIPRGVGYEIEGKINNSHKPDNVFEDLKTFCGGDGNKARTLALLLHQGEASHSINPLGRGQTRAIDKAGYFVKIRRRGDTIEIQLWVATALGSKQDHQSKQTTPKPLWGCVQLTVKESDLATGTFSSLERTIFYHPRRTWDKEATLGGANALRGSEALLRFNQEFISPSHS